MNLKKNQHTKKQDTSQENQAALGFFCNCISVWGWYRTRTEYQRNYLILVEAKWAIPLHN